jgi:hypothetical protein
VRPAGGDRESFVRAGLGVEREAHTFRDDATGIKTERICKRQ